MSLKTTQFPPIIIADKTVTVLTGQTKSEAVDLLGTVLVAFITEDTLAAAGSVTFESSLDGVTYLPTYNDAAIPLAVSVQTGRYIVLDITDFAAMRFIKFVLDVVEGSDVVFKLLTRPAL